ncbi:MAG: DUF6607 family protein [Chitinophagales bacterium]
MKRTLSSAVVILFSASLQAQGSKDKQALPPGRQDIEKLCGCYEVEFKYAETFSPDPAYKFHERDEISGGIELILPIEASDKKIVLQHLLVITDSMIIKHWREDWTYENPTIFRYQGNKLWTKEQLTPEDVKGKWTQSVWEVSDAPRYQGASEWIRTDGKTFWQNTSDAPLPRREYSVRNDYNILKRTNRLTLTDFGWVHEQDNQKIIRHQGSDKLLAEEKGVNSYKKTDESKCAAAKAYWEKNKAYWAKVRTAWENYMSSHTSVELKDTEAGKPLHQYLTDLAADFAKGKVKPQEIDATIKTSLEKFIGRDQTVAQSQ